MKTTPLYIWEKEIKWVKKNIVTFMDGTKDTFTEKQLKYMITKEKNDLTAQRDQLIKEMIPEVMDILEQYNIKQVDLGNILEAIKSSYRYTLDVAVGKAFGTYTQNGSPEDFWDNIRVSDLKRVGWK